MNAILDNPLLRSRVHLWSIDEYHKLIDSGQIEKNLELIHGVAIEKMSKSPRHAFAVSELLKLLLLRNITGICIRSEQPITIADSEPEPDIAIIQGAALDFQNEHPHTALCVIEVAVSSLEYDLEKADIYATAKIPQFFILDLDARKIYEFSEPRLNQYQNRTVRDFGSFEIQSLGVVELNKLLGGR